jgi:hypothetical protein
LQKEKVRRSGEQNRYYWGVVIKKIGDAICEADPNEVHDMLKAEFNSEILVFGDMEIKKPMSTSKLGTAGFCEYVEKIRQWAWKHLQLDIPKPNTGPINEVPV